MTPSKEPRWEQLEVVGGSTTWSDWWSPSGPDAQAAQPVPGRTFHQHNRFLMSIFLVPSVTALLGTRAWWPRKLTARPAPAEERQLESVG